MFQRKKKHLNLCVNYLHCIRTRIHKHTYERSRSKNVSTEITTFKMKLIYKSNSTKIWWIAIYAAKSAEWLIARENAHCTYVKLPLNAIDKNCPTHFRMNGCRRCAFYLLPCLVFILNSKLLLQIIFHARLAIPRQHLRLHCVYMCANVPFFGCFFCYIRAHMFACVHHWST